MAVYATTITFYSSITGTAAYNLAGARAEKKVNGPGSFQVHFLDQLYEASAYDIAKNPFEIKEV